MLGAIQPSQMCIFNKKYSKLTFSNGPQLMRKGLWQICMHHWTVHAKVEFQKCPWDVSLAGVHSTTLDPELRNERFTLISFMGFPAMLGAIQPSQMCIFNKKYSKLTFSNGPQMMRKSFMANLHASLDSTCKSRISKMSMRCQTCRGPFHNFDPELRNERFTLISFIRVSCNIRCMYSHLKCAFSIKNIVN